ncbi:MAG: hypothetical protein FWH12_05120 [Treponema sp.]|nr:hypothetical protein [Treponema sp.]
MSFPRTTVAGVSLPRLLIGSNWMHGYSHKSNGTDTYIKNLHASGDETAAILKAFLKHGIDAWMAAFSTKPNPEDLVKMYQDKVGQKLILIDTPVLNMDDTPAARKESEDIIKMSAKIGSTFCMIHHASCEQLVNRNKKTMDRLGDYTDMIRQAGLIPGLTAHMPEIVIYTDLNGYDVETYVQIFNCMGFLMQIEIESVIKTIHGAKKPVMTIKPMAAGRVTPYVGLTFNFNVLRDQDMVTVGCLHEHEVDEDVEISLAALEHRLPNLEARSSPAKQSIIR